MIIRTMRRAVSIAILITVVAIASARSADALTISQSQPFSAAGLGAIGVTPFDPALGTLDKVFVNISGKLVVGGTTGPNALPFLPYLYGVTVSQDYFGLAGKYFDFITPAQFLFMDFSPGTGESLTFATNYSFDFNVTAISDLFGFIFPTTTTTSGVLIPPIPGIDAKQSDFVKQSPPVDEVDLSQHWSSFTTGGNVSVSSVNASGLLQIAYQYTPAAAISGPATLVLLGTGLAVVATGLRRPR